MPYDGFRLQQEKNDGRASIIIRTAKKSLNN